MYAIKSKKTGDWVVDDHRYDSFEYENFDIPNGVNAVIISHVGSLCFYKDDGYERYLKEGKDHKVLWHREKVEVEGEKLDTDAMLADIDVQIATHSQHGHYFKDVRDLNVIDVYQVLRLFNVTDPCLQHIVKKALVTGGRGHKNFERDLKDIHDTSKRALEINNIKH